MGVMITNLPKPIRYCECTSKKEVPAKTIIEKIQAFFGKKFYIDKPAAIIADMSSHLEGKSKVTI